MATSIYLGMPPAKIVDWIQANYKPDMTKVPLHFTANEDNSSVSLVCHDNLEGLSFIDSWVKLDYSMNGTTWNTYIDPDSSDETLRKGKVINLNKDETVYFRATLGDVDGNPNLNGFGYYDEGWEDLTKFHYFVMEGSIKADGNIQFLLENSGIKLNVPDYCYWSMFQNCTSLTQAPELPATTLARECYRYMFSSCSSLTQAPALPATTLADSCYWSMFQNCTSLTQAPALPATTLADYCYSYMFQNCTSLTQAPELPATTLARECYRYMFSSCSSLTQAPALPATTLAEECYYGMF